MHEKVSKNSSLVGLPEYMRTAQAAKYTGVSASTLAKLRMERNREKGPRFSKVAGCVVYRRVDLDAWLEANVVDETRQV